MLQRQATTAVLKRQATGTMVRVGKVFVVAFDGSRASVRAARLAAWLAVTDVRDKVKLVSVVKNPADMSDCVKMLEDVEQKFVSEMGLRRPQLLPTSIAKLAEGETVVSALAAAASGGHLILGACGKRIESEQKNTGPGSARPGSAAVSGGNQLGETASQSMVTCRAPVVIAKPKATSKMDTKRGMSDRAMNKAAMTIVVPVDARMASQKCFDMALRFAKKGDIVHVVHVINSDKMMLRPHAEPNELIGDSAVRQYYKSACAKAEFERNGATEFEFVQEQTRKGSSVSDAIVAKCEELLADIVIMSSIELARSDGGANIHLGSVSAAVAKRTGAHVLIAKSFA